MKALLATATFLSALCVPATAGAGLASITFRDVPLHGERALASSPGTFDLVGLKWHGPGDVRFSVRAASGRFGPWLDATPEEDDQPDVGTREEMRSRGWRLANPTWVGPSTAIRYRVTGRVSGLRASFVRSPESRIPLRAVAAAGAPAIVPRSAWDADEAIRRNQPEYAPNIRFAIVHHTAGPNDYSPAQAAAIVRGIELYHVKSNGWNDIGYNFLVDRYGTVYEGRYGGIDRNVVGAHALGFNTGSVGVAVIGTFEGSAPPPAAQAALAKLLAWRLDLAHVDPLSTLTAISGGSERYPAGLPVFLRAISGHRDTGQTSCPGDQLYARLGAIAQVTRSIGLPKIFEPKITGGLGAPIRFRARLSGPGPWTVSVADPSGQELARGDGQGPTLDWTWDASSVSVTGVRWRMAAGPATPATGTLGTAVPVGGSLAISALDADPATISPNDDGVAESSTITYSLTAAASVVATLLDSSGTVIAELLPATDQAPGDHTLTFDGLGQPDGVYTVVVTATSAGGVQVSRQAAITVTRTLSSVGVAPAVFTPNGDGRGDTLRVTFQLAAPATVRLRVLLKGVWVATPFAEPLAAGPQTVEWDGTKRVGSAPDGSYDAVLEATDASGTASVSLPFVRDARPPVIRISSRPPRVWVSEPAIVTVRVNGAARRSDLEAAGTVQLPGVKRVRSLVVVARDRAGNRTVARFP